MLKKAILVMTSRAKMKRPKGKDEREVNLSDKRLYSKDGDDRVLLDSFYNKSLANLMRLDQTSFEESEDLLLQEPVGFEDMINMERMEEEMVLSNLKERYMSRQIYVGWPFPLFSRLTPSRPSQEAY